MKGGFFRFGFECSKTVGWVNGSEKERYGMPEYARVGILEFVNGIDPSAGSPTETLLRLLLPLSDKVH